MIDNVVYEIPDKLQSYIAFLESCQISQTHLFILLLYCIGGKRNLFNLLVAQMS